MKKRRVFIILLVLAMISGSLWLIIANPFNFFVPHSKRFSLKRFQSIAPGTSMIAAINLLGKPIKVVKGNKYDDCPTCVSYCFMGEPPSWVIGFQEAWLIADHRGVIVRSFKNTEP